MWAFFYKSTALSRLIRAFKPGANRLVEILVAVEGLCRIVLFQGEAPEWFSELDQGLKHSGAGRINRAMRSHAAQSWKLLALCLIMYSLAPMALADLPASEAQYYAQGIARDREVIESGMTVLTCTVATIAGCSMLWSVMDKLGDIVTWIDDRRLRRRRAQAID